MLLAQNTGDTRALNSKTKVGDNKSKVWCKVWTKAKKKKKRKEKGSQVNAEIEWQIKKRGRKE